MKERREPGRKDLSSPARASSLKETRSPYSDKKGVGTANYQRTVGSKCWRSVELLFTVLSGVFGVHLVSFRAYHPKVEGRNFRAYKIAWQRRE